MTSRDSLCVNERGIAHDTIDGEVIIVNFENGQYFSLSGSAAAIWHWLVGGHGVSDIVEHVAANYVDADPACVESFVRQLIAEGLLESRQGAPSEPREILTAEPGRSFSPPKFEKYGDMEELIRLDPIHQVDATGWPNKAA